MEDKKTYYLSELQREAREELEERIKEEELILSSSIKLDDVIAEISDKRNISNYCYGVRKRKSKERK